MAAHATAHAFDHRALGRNVRPADWDTIMAACNFVLSTPTIRCDGLGWVVELHPNGQLHIVIAPPATVPELAPPERPDGL